MDAESTKETLQQLYSLRAALSVVDLEYDKFANEEQEYEEFKKGINKKISEEEKVHKLKRKKKIDANQALQKDIEAVEKSFEEHIRTSVKKDLSYEDAIVEKKRKIYKIFDWISDIPVIASTIPIAIIVIFMSLFSIFAIIFDRISVSVIEGALFIFPQIAFIIYGLLILVALINLKTLDPDLLTPFISLIFGLLNVALQLAISDVWKSKILGILIDIAIVLFVIGFYVFIKFSKIKSKYLSEEWDKAKSDYNRKFSARFTAEKERRILELNTMQNEKYQMHAAQIQNCEEELQKSDMQLQEYARQKEEMASMSNEKKNGICKKVFDIYDITEKEFSSLLDSRDWENLDLIIYLVETGRADSIKEALQQLDMYRHTERIVGVLKSATDTIVQNINLNFSELKNTIERSATRISMKLNRIAQGVESLAEGQNLVSDGLKTLNNSAKETALAIEMQNALIKKQTVTSTEMAENVRKMRTYADEAYLKQMV